MQVLRLNCLITVKDPQKADPKFYISVLSNRRNEQGYEVISESATTFCGFSVCMGFTESTSFSEEYSVWGRGTVYGFAS